MEKEFNEITLESNLSLLTYHSKVLFMLSCCERLFPNYKEFTLKHRWGDPKVIRESLDYIWFNFYDKTNKNTIKKLIKKCEIITPNTEDFGTIYASLALDATVCTRLLLEFLTKKSIKIIINIASQAIDTVDMFIQEYENMEPNDPDLEYKILTHPLMQKELKRQREDIEYLMKVGFIDEKEIIKLKNEWYNQRKSNINL